QNHLATGARSLEPGGVRLAVVAASHGGGPGVCGVRGRVYLHGDPVAVDRRWGQANDVGPGGDRGGAERYGDYHVRATQYLRSLPRRVERLGNIAHIYITKYTAAPAV